MQLGKCLTSFSTGHGLWWSEWNLFIVSFAKFTKPSWEQYFARADIALLLANMDKKMFKANNNPNSTKSLFSPPKWKRLSRPDKEFVIDWIFFKAGSFNHETRAFCRQDKDMESNHPFLAAKCSLRKILGNTRPNDFRDHLGGKNSKKDLESCCIYSLVTSSFHRL